VEVHCLPRGPDEAADAVVVAEVASSALRRSEKQRRRQAALHTCCRRSAAGSTGRGKPAENDQTGRQQVVTTALKALAGHALMPGPAEIRTARRVMTGATPVGPALGRPTHQRPRDADATNVCPRLGGRSKSKSTA